MPKLKRLFHGTTPEALPYIQEEGIKPSRWEGLIYTSVDRTEALIFTSFRQGNKYEYDEKGQVTKMT